MHQKSPIGEILLLKSLHLSLFCGGQRTRHYSVTPARSPTKNPVSGLTPALRSSQAFSHLFGIPRVEVHEVSSRNPFCSMCHQGVELSDVV